MQTPGTSTSVRPVEDAAKAIREALLADAHLLCYEPSQHDLTVPDLRRLTYVKWPGKPPPTTVYLKAYLTALGARPDKLPQKRDAPPAEVPSAPVSASATDRSRSPRPRSAVWEPPRPSCRSLPPALARPVKFPTSLLSPSRSELATWSFVPCMPDSA